MPVWRPSVEPNTLIVSCAGLDMDPNDLALLIECKLPAASLKYDPRTHSFEMGLIKGTDAEAVIEKGLQWAGRVFSIERPYHPSLEFSELQLSGLPMVEENNLREYVIKLLGNKTDILRITPTYCFCTSLHTGQATVAVKGSSEDWKTRGRYLYDGDREVFLSWKGAPPVCRRCKAEGHHERKCTSPPQSNPTHTPRRQQFTPLVRTYSQATQRQPPKIASQSAQQSQPAQRGWTVVKSRKDKRTKPISRLVDPPT